MNDEQTKAKRFFQLYNSVQLRLYSYLVIVLHNTNDAEDVLQETSIVLWEKFDDYQEGTNFGAWAIAIARNKSLRFMDNNKRTRQLFSNDFYKRVSELASISVGDVDQRSEALQICLEKVPDDGKELLTMKYTKEMSYQKISQYTGRSVNNLYSYFCKLNRALKICIEKRIEAQGA